VYIQLPDEYPVSMYKLKAIRELMAIVLLLNFGLSENNCRKFFVGKFYAFGAKSYCGENLGAK